ncbi:MULTISPECIES: hypothetical protein [Agrobacterium]|uniref:hypothetical protein n=1 Tax=Agrobacterium TaxID=357 RepID=UPI0023016509|nr:MULTISPECIES: hypothetical protein [Agrobacterium]MDA5631101.1 hypothetical protein [Agrobacterium sp. ST15.16.055]MDA6980352.1 hypothetical protein [Agrobacterium salinitolerans]
MTGLSIQSIEPVERPASFPGAARTIAKFTVELDGVRLFGLLLRESPDGSRRIVAPNIAGRHSVTFRRDIAEQITVAASNALGGRIAETAENPNR